MAIIKKSKELSIKFKRALFVCLGLFFVVLAYFGIIMPGVPAIPFILLALFFFANGSENLHAWMLRQKIIAKIVSKTYTKKANIGFKLFVISQLWVSIIVAETIFVTTIFQGILLIIAGVGLSFVTYVLIGK